MSIPELSLVIPCYNEQGSLQSLVARCAECFNGHDVEVVLVDNGSTDATADLLPALINGHDHVRTVRVPQNQGYGFGILSGLAVARGSVLGWTHADLQADPADALQGLKLFRAARDPQQLFVKGLRYGRDLRDVVFTWGMSAAEALILGVALRDINAQPNLFHRAFYDTWSNPPHDFSLDLYVYQLAVRAGLEVGRFPVFFGKRHSGVGHNDTLLAKLKYSRRTLEYSVRLRQHLSIIRGKRC